MINRRNLLKAGAAGALAAPLAAAQAREFEKGMRCRSNILS